MLDFAARFRAISDHTSDRWLYAWALGYAAIGAASLLVPLYALALGGGPLLAGVLEATAGFAGVPGALLWGRLADRTGQRRVFVLVSLVGTGLALSVVPLLDDLLLVVIANAVLWFAVAAATPVVTLFVIDGQPESRWEERIGRLNAYQQYGWVGGLVAGTLWLGAISLRYSTLFAQRTFFACCAAAALLAVPLAVYWLPPEATASPRRLSRSAAFGRVVTGAGRIVKLVPFTPGRALATLVGRSRPGLVRRLSPPLRRYLLVAFTFSVAFATFFGPVPAYLDDLGFASAAIFGVFIVSNVASAVAFVPIGRRAAGPRAKPIQSAALGVRVLLFPVIGAVGLLAAPGVRTAGIALGFALIGLTWAVVVVTANGLVSRIATPAVRGEALGLFAAVAGVGGGIGGVLGGLLAGQFGYQVAFAVAGAGVLVSLLVLLASTLPFATAPAAAGEPADES